jgi:syntaxin-binding protein 1
MATPLVVFNREGQELSTRDMQKMVQALPQYRDQLDKLSLHIHVRSSS